MQNYIYTYIHVLFNMLHYKIKYIWWISCSPEVTMSLDGSFGRWEVGKFFCPDISAEWCPESRWSHFVAPPKYPKTFSIWTRQKLSCGWERLIVAPAGSPFHGGNMDTPSSKPLPPNRCWVQDRVWKTNGPRQVLQSALATTCLCWLSESLWFAASPPQDKLFEAAGPFYFSSDTHPMRPAHAVPQCQLPI